MIGNDIQLATFGGGCFWCIEAIFNEVKGVEKVISGYTGGNVPGSPTYREVSSGLTGHAEAVKVTFDASIISYEDLLFIFMTCHDPTTSNIKEAYIGSQYRSVIYYHNEHQKEIAKAIVKEMTSYFEGSITTEISSAVNFYVAEDYHQKYFANNQTASYCNAIIAPKLAKFRKMHARKLKNLNSKMKI